MFFLHITSTTLHLLWGYSGSSGTQSRCLLVLQNFATFLASDRLIIWIVSCARGRLISCHFGARDLVDARSDSSLLLGRLILHHHLLLCLTNWLEIDRWWLSFVGLVNFGGLWRFGWRVITVLLHLLWRVLLFLATLLGRVLFVTARRRLILTQLALFLFLLMCTFLLINLILIAVLLLDLLTSSHLHLSVCVIQNVGSFWKVDQGYVFANEFWDDWPDIVYVRERFKQRNHFKKASIVGIVVPGQDWHGVFWVKEVCIRRIVHNYHIFHWSADQRQVLNIATLEREAMLSVKAHRNEAILIKRINQRIGVDIHRGCIEYDLVHLGQLLEEKENARPDQNVNLNRSTFNYDSHLKVALSSSTTRLYMSQRKLGVNQSFVEVQNESFTTGKALLLRRYDSILGRHRHLAKPARPVQFYELIWRKIQLLFQELLSGLRCHRRLLCLLGRVLGLVRRKPLFWTHRFSAILCVVLMHSSKFVCGYVYIQILCKGFSCRIIRGVVCDYISLSLCFVTWVVCYLACEVLVRLGLLKGLNEIFNKGSGALIYKYIDMCERILELLLGVYFVRM